MNAKDTNEILKDVTAGKYRGQYVVYARKSTDEPENQKNSIAFQKAEVTRYAGRERLPIASLTLPGFCTNGIVSERHSAFKEADDIEFGDNGRVSYRVERPKFHRLASLLSAGRFKGVIFLCWDRASRNKGDELILRKLMKAGVDVRFVLATYDDTSAGELHKDIDGMFSEHHSRVTREKVKDAIEKSREKGWATHMAPVGYLNQGSMQRKPFDEERASLIRRLFEKADQTDLSLSDLRRWIIDQGFTMPPKRRRRSRQEMLEDEEQDARRETEKISHLPTVSQVHNMLSNPFYTGKVWGNGGGWVKSTSHRPLVSEALFKRVQQKLAIRRTSVHYDKKLALPFRGFVRCRCGRVFSPYVRKGITYFGARCDRSCDNPRKSVNLAFVEDAAGSVLAGLALTSDERTQVETATNQAVTRLENRRALEREAVVGRVAKLRADLGYLTDNRLTLLRTNAYTPEALVAEEARLTHEIEGLEAEPSISASQLGEAVANVVRLSELLQTAQQSYGLATRDFKETFARTVLSELILSENTLSFRCRSGFRAFERRFVSESALDCRFSELVTHRDEVRGSIQDITGILQLIEGHEKRP